MHFRHLRAERLLDAYADGNIGQRARAVVTRHLAECGKCRIDLLLTEKLRAALILSKLAVDDVAVRARLEDFAKQMTGRV